MNIIRNKVIKSSVLCLLLISMSAQAVNFAGLRNVFTKAGKTLANTKLWQKMFKTKKEMSILEKTTDNLKFYLTHKNTLPYAAVIGGTVATVIIMHKIAKYMNYRKARKEVFSELLDVRKLEAAINSRYGCLVEEVLDNCENINLGQHVTSTFLFKVVKCTFYNRFDGRYNLVKRMIENMFTNVVGPRSNGKTVSEHIEIEQEDIDSLPGNDKELKKFLQEQLRIKAYLQEKEKQHRDLIDRVYAVEDDLKNGQNLNNVSTEFAEIKKLIENKAIPGYAKMLVLPKLVDIYKAHNNLKFCTEKDMGDLYKHIVFNESFTIKEKFRSAVEFALEHAITDMNGKCADEAILMYDTYSDLAKKAIEHFFEKRTEFYKNPNILKNWIATRPDQMTGGFKKVKGLWVGIKNKWLANKSQKIYLAALNQAEEDEDEKKLKGLLDAANIHMMKLKK